MIQRMADLTNIALATRQVNHVITVTWQSTKRMTCFLTQAFVLCTPFAVWHIPNSFCRNRLIGHFLGTTRTIKNGPHSERSAKYGSLCGPWSATGHLKWVGHLQSMPKKVCCVWTLQGLSFGLLSATSLAVLRPTISVCVSYLLFVLSQVYKLSSTKADVDYVVFKAQ